MIKTAKLLSAIIILVFLTTYKPNIKNKSYSKIFPLENILIENNKILTSRELTEELKYLSGNNLLLISNKIIKQELEQFNYISGFKVKKIYPNTIKISMKKKL